MKQLMETWHCRYPELTRDVKFIFTKTALNGELFQIIRACMEYRNPPRQLPITFSPEHPFLRIETEEIKSTKNNPAFERHRQTAMEIIEGRVKDFHRIRGIVGIKERKQFEDLEALSQDFVPWQLDKVARTGDVERGAEQTLMTRQGAELMAKNRISPRLRRKLAEALIYRRSLLGRSMRNGHK